MCTQDLLLLVVIGFISAYFFHINFLRQFSISKTAILLQSQFCKLNNTKGQTRQIYLSD